MALKYDNDFIKKYVEKDGNWELIDINGVGKDAVITIWCKEKNHEYKQTTFANFFYKSFECRECKKDNVIKNIIYPILNKYEVISIDYVNNDWRKSRVTLWCREEGHDCINVTFKSIENGNIRGCKECRKITHYKKIKKEVENINKVLIDVIKYNNKDYNKSKILIWCGNKNHKYIKTTLNKVMNSNIKCETCEKEYRISVMKSFVEELGYEFYGVSNYCKSDFIKSMVKVKCNLDGYVFTIRFSSLKYEGKRCPHCSMSYGEQEVARVLKKYKIPYHIQYRFKDCIDLKTLPFDFKIDKRKILIEYDGAQHFRPVDLFDGEEGFKICKKHDKIKNDYCEKNGIKLIRIPYWDFRNIEKIICQELKIKKYE